MRAKSRNPAIIPTAWGKEFSIEETRCVLEGGLPMPVEIGPAGRVGSSYKTRSQTPLPVTSLDTKTHQPSFFHEVLPQEPLHSSSFSLPPKQDGPVGLKFE
ncbi:hypothetical protein K0M31_013274 [Melipona bicolor]|uniref:Uncharacterized protein n=1 Tax=Melipona bicolor TaxID=60889 RepID=A0AA40FI71_9HYME|nr:hypothetical protein K0M31_013274 [Melipona bicolor]